MEYLRLLLSSAWRKTMRDVTGETHTQRIVRLLTVAFGVVTAWMYTTYWSPISGKFGDAITTLILTSCVTFALLVGGLVLNILFVTPYELWKEQKARADAVETANGFRDHSDRARFDDALLELRHIANAREMWWAHGQRSGEDTGLGARLLKAIDDVRRCFPPGADSDPQGDQITRLHTAVASYGRILGFARSETPKLQASRETFEREMAAIADRFDQLERGKLTEHDLNTDRERKRALIAVGRDLAHRFRTEQPTEAFETFIRKQRRFFDIQPHLGLGYQQWVSRNANVAHLTDDGSDVPSAMFLRELARLENEWGLT